MKMNILVITPQGGKFAGNFPHSSLSGEVVEGPQSYGDEIIDSIDESRMAPEQILIKRFFGFLGSRGYSWESFLILPNEEQQRLKQEFLGE